MISHLISGYAADISQQDVPNIAAINNRLFPILKPKFCNFAPVKKIGHIYLLLILVAICSLITGNANDMFACSQINGNESVAASKIERIQSKHALIENIYLNIQIAPSLHKNHVDDSYACICSFEMLFGKQSLAELSHFQCIVSKLKKTDVIFPFHYFW